MVSITITDILNDWAEFGVFAYLLPALMIFAIVYGILQRAKFLGDNKAVNAVVALTVGLLALQFDYVSTFFGNLVPYAGIGIAVLLIAMILMGVMTDKPETQKWILFGIGALIFIIVMLYTIKDYAWLGGYSGGDYLPWIVLILIIAGAFVGILLGDKNKGGAPPK